MTLEFSRVTLAGPLWTVADLKAQQLRITDAAQDDDVSQKIDAAQEWVLAYLGAGADPDWTETTAPRAVRHGIALLATHWYEHRGDDFGNQQPQEAIIWRELERCLSPYRDIGVG